MCENSKAVTILIVTFVHLITKKIREQYMHNLLILLGKDMFVKLKRKTPLKLSCCVLWL